MIIIGYCEYPPDLKVRLEQVEQQPSHGHLSEVCPGVWTRVSGPLNICCYSYRYGILWFDICIVHLDTSEVCPGVWTSLVSGPFNICCYS